MRFVIIASMRTGSSHLVNTLSGHPEIFCHGNVFAPQMMPIFWPTPEQSGDSEAETIKEEFRQLRAADSRLFLKSVFLLNHGRENVGFKIFRDQNDAVLSELIKDREIRKIVLFRRNVLANYASSLAAGATGTWGIKKGEALPEIQPVNFKPRQFIKFYNKYIEFYKDVMDQLNNAREPFELINYEEINDRTFLSRLVSFIGGDPRLLISEEQQRKSQVKQNSSDIISRFANRADVKKFLVRNGLDHWAREGQVSLESLAARK